MLGPEWVINHSFLQKNPNLCKKNHNWWFQNNLPHYHHFSPKRKKKKEKEAKEISKCRWIWGVCHHSFQKCPIVKNKIGTAYCSKGLSQVNGCYTFWLSRCYIFDFLSCVFRLTKFLKFVFTRNDENWSRAAVMEVQRRAGRRRAEEDGGKQTGKSWRRQGRWAWQEVEEQLLRRRVHQEE